MTEPAEAENAVTDCFDDEAVDKAAQAVVDASVAVRLEAILSGHLKTLDSLFEDPGDGAAVETEELVARPVDPYAPPGKAAPGGADADFYRLLADADPAAEIAVDDPDDRPVPHVLEEIDEDADVPASARSGRRGSASLRRRAAVIAYWGRFARQGGVRLVESTPRPLIWVAPLMIAALGGALLLGVVDGEMPSAPESRSADGGRSPAYGGLLAARTPPPGEQAQGPLLPQPEPTADPVDIDGVIAAYAAERPVAAAPVVTAVPPPTVDVEASAEEPSNAADPLPPQDGNAVASIEAVEPQMRPSVTPEEPVVEAAPIGPAVEPEEGLVPEDVDTAAPTRRDLPAEPAPAAEAERGGGLLAYGPDEFLLANEIADAVLAERNDAAAASDGTAIATTPPETEAPPIQVSRQTGSRSFTIGAGVAAANAYVNMRSGPDNDAATITVVPKGADVLVVGCKIWCEVTYQGQRGFIFPRFLAQR